MINCRNCKYWNNYDEAVGECSLAESRNDEPAHPGNQKLPYVFVARDAEGWAAGLETSGEFGCIAAERR